MSPDRVVASFVVGWIVLVAILIALDWLADPNRGSFRPKGEQPPADRSVRRAERKRHRLDDDAAVRATLRDAYGSSSLRLKWSRDQEARAREVDDSLIVGATDEHRDEKASPAVMQPAAPPARSPSVPPADPTPSHPTAGRGATWGRRGERPDRGSLRSNDLRPR